MVNSNSNSARTMRASTAEAPDRATRATSPGAVPTQDSPKKENKRSKIRHLLGFVGRVWADFRANRGILIAGALGYNTLLSIVPLFALILVVLSHIVSEPLLLETMVAQAEATFPGKGGVVTDAFIAFLDQREVLGGLGFVVMLFFSTIAFRMLDDAMRAVFRRSQPRRRHWLTTVFIPLAYVGLIGLGILFLTLVMVAFDALPEGRLIVFGQALDAGRHGLALVKLLAFFGLVGLLASFYGLMPGARVRKRFAALGGLVAALLWEGVRSLLMWYFANLSLVDVVYGSLATVIVLLVSLEIAAIILLLGAEVIAQLQRSYEHGLRWYEAPPEYPLHTI